MSKKKKKNYEQLKQEHEELQAIHHQALHELADAVQIIKSYEFLQDAYIHENKTLKRIVALAEDLCSTRSSTTFMRKRARLQQAIYEFMASNEGAGNTSDSELGHVSPELLLQDNPLSIN